MSEIENKDILYELLGRSKYEWQRTSRNLITSSNILYRESQQAYDQMVDFLKKSGSASDEEFPAAGTFVVARMLTGMALENLIKGLIIQNDPTHVSKDKKIGLKSHNLGLLWTKYLPAISICDSEKALLEELSNSIIWKGRYPIPVSSDKFESPKSFDNEITTINNIYRRLIEAY